MALGATDGQVELMTRRRSAGRAGCTRTCARRTPSRGWRSHRQPRQGFHPALVTAFFPSAIGLDARARHVILAFATAFAFQLLDIFTEALAMAAMKYGTVHVAAPRGLRFGAHSCMVCTDRPSRRGE